MYWNASNLYGWTMSQKLPVEGVKRKQEVGEDLNVCVLNLLL